MATPIIFLLVIIGFSSSALTSAKSNTTMIESTCKTTHYFDLCVSILESDPRSRTADEKGLAAIMVSVGMINATSTATYLAGNLTSATNDPILKKVLQDCSEKYTLAADSLRLTIQDLDDEAYDYAFLLCQARQYFRKSESEHWKFIFPYQFASHTKILSRV